MSVRAGLLTSFALLLAAVSGCVTVYHPYSPLQRPVVLNLQNPNLEGLKIKLECIPSDFLVHYDAVSLCNQISKAVTAQGAEVVQLQVGKEVENAGADSANAAPKPFDISIQLKSWQLFDKTNWWLVFPFLATLTFVPIQEEYAFATQMTIMSGTGFFLNSEIYQGRFVRYIGAGYWGVNLVFNELLRKEEDRIDDESIAFQFSSDLYRHVSQSAYNAKMRLELLKLASSSASGGN